MLSGVLIFADDWKPVPDDTYPSATPESDRSRRSYICVSLLGKSKDREVTLGPLPRGTMQKDDIQTVRMFSALSTPFIGEIEKLRKGIGRVYYLRRQGKDTGVVVSYDEEHCKEDGAVWPKTSKQRIVPADIWTDIAGSGGGDTISGGGYIEGEVED